MRIKPHIHRGRFYNHPDDSILVRLKDMAKCIVHIAKKRLKKSGRRTALLGCPVVASQWSVTPILHSTSDDLRITWLGHATFLIQVNGINILTDPVFHEISSVTKRFLPAPLQIHQLPSVDVIIISHNHPDHVNEKSLRELAGHQPQVFVPLGNKKWFKKRGFEAVSEMTWWDDVDINVAGRSLKLSFLPASHWTSRGLFDINKTLWGSWMISAGQQNIYFAGDTAYSDHFKIIGKHFGAIDIALMPAGPNEPRALMHDAHVSSEQAIDAFLDLGARHFIPMHWGTFMFGIDSFLDPIHKLEQHWHIKKHDLENKVLNVMKFGESRMFE